GGDLIHLEPWVAPSGNAPGNRTGFPEHDVQLEPTDPIGVLFEDPSIVRPEPLREIAEALPYRVQHALVTGSNAAELELGLGRRGVVRVFLELGKERIECG